jgi:hypothetical protein
MIQQLTATSQLRMPPQYDVYSGFNINKLYGRHDPGKWMAIREWVTLTFIGITEEALLLS